MKRKKKLPTKRSTAKKTAAGKRAPKKARAQARSRVDPAAAYVDSSLRLIERRKHPRFILTHEQFREVRTGKIFTVYDLSVTGLAIKVEKQEWKEGTIIQGVLNLHPESIEIMPRLVGYYGDRAALKLEALSTYSKSVLERSLSPRRLGTSLKLIRQKLPLADYWYHGVCNTDLLVRLSGDGGVRKADLFFANLYWGWSDASSTTAKSAAGMTTGICQSFGPDRREPAFLADEPVLLESIDIDHDHLPDPKKVDWARGIVESAQLDGRLKETLMDKMKVEP
ncbi:MAG: PilZ domain-containing protein [Deltaproteobacteria bacterium]|nr:PilZ domain-containing protein [Deltaproteobacteria bacterium]